MNEYDKQAKAFLEATNTQMDIVRVPETIAEKPVFADELAGMTGNHYKVKMTRGNQTYMFDFWGSYNDKMENKRPRPYDVLTCLDATVDDNYTLGEFCSDYGYSGKDIDRAVKVFENVKEQTRELRKLYNESELEQLQEIQ